MHSNITMKTETKLKNRYATKPDEVREYMNDLIDQLVLDYGSINPSWSLSLDMISDWYDVYVKAKSEIGETGVSFMSSRGDFRTHPAFNAMNTASSQIQHLLKSFAASPYQKSKMKALDKDVRDESEYMKAILEN